MAADHRDVPALRSLIHLGLNMLVLWFIGPPLEEYFGHWRYLLVYLVSGLAGSAGAAHLVAETPTVGASGAICGIMGAALVLEARAIWVFGGRRWGSWSSTSLITFLIPGSRSAATSAGSSAAASARSRSRASALTRARDALDGLAVGVLSVGLAAAQVA